MGVVATLLPNTKHLQRLRLALRARHDVIVCGDWGSLVRVCEQQPVGLAFVDIFGDGDQGAADRIRRLKLRLPRLTLIAYITFTPERAYDLFEAGRQGADGLIIADQHDSPGLCWPWWSRRIRAVSAASSGRRSRVWIQWHATRCCWRSPMPMKGLSSVELARRLSLHRRTLSTHLMRAGFPSAQRLLTWGHLVVAGQALEDRHRSAQRVASALGFPSGSAFRNTCQRYLHASRRKGFATRGGGGLCRSHDAAAAPTSSPRGGQGSG